jgi:predicted dehydrogenase
MPATAPVRFGILGAANIARQFCRGVAGSKLVAVEAVASRDGSKAAAFGHECGIPRHHGSYQALLADPAVEAVYIPLPNSMHAEWIMKALAAGKHVLCEKPFTLTGAEAGAAYAAASAAGLHLAEAYPYMSQPQTLRLRALLAEGAIGRVQLASAAFGFAITSPEGAALVDPANIRLRPEVGGGALLDAGTYAMSLLRIAVGEAPARVRAAGRLTQGGVDQTVAATLEFPSGAIGQLTTSLATAQHRHAVIIGERGVIETGYANHAPPGEATLPLRIKRGAAGTVAFETETLPAGDGFLAEAESFARMLREGPAAWNGASEAESVDTVAALEAIAHSLRSGGGWVALAD